MDVVKTKKTSWMSKHSAKLLPALVIATMTILIVWIVNKDSVFALARQDLLIETVQQGDLEVHIEGYGSLSSDKQQLITSYSVATVKEIVLKPGASVSQDSVIVRLENPELQQQLESAQQDLTQAQANLRQLKLNNQREKLNETANLAEIKAQYDTSALRKAAEEKLVEQGVVSQLTFQQTVLDTKQLAERIEILKERIAQLDLVHKESVNIQQERVKQQQGQVDVAKNRMERLTVRAGFDGVLQRLSVEIGQSLTAGQEIALIGSVDSLIALIRVPQSQAQLVTVGKKAIIDTRRDKIDGVVSRIDPIVENNSVEIEIALPANLPASARPQQSVDGIIIADKLENVTYVKRPAGAQSNTTAKLFTLAANTNRAQLQDFRFGVQAGQFIQVVSGAEVGEQLVISDLSEYQNTSDVLVIN